MRAFLERFRSPARKATSEAGPPERSVIAGFLLGGLLVLLGWWSGALGSVPWPLWAIIPAAVLTIIALVDRDGWNVRRAMAYVALQQRARWSRGPLPATPSIASAWLQDPANADAHPLERISVLIAVGDVSAGRALLETYVPASDVQFAAVARTKAYIRALETGTTDMAPVIAATEVLSAEDRRYQLAAAAWAQAVLDIGAHRPWRRRFADSVRDLGPFPVAGRYQAIIAIQQLAAPIATILATGIMAVALG